MKKKIEQISLSLITERLKREIDAGTIPGAAIAVGIGKDTFLQEAFGYAENRNGIIRPMSLDTIFDLASLTKVMATLPAILLLLERGHICLNDTVGYFIPAYGEGNKSSVTIKHLLTHTSGLPQIRRFYLQKATREDVLDAAMKEPLEYDPGTKVIYSDLGFILLGEITKIVSGLSLDKFVYENIYDPLDMTQTSYNPDANLIDRVAATEIFNHGDSARVGVVHDRNAEVLGGVSGHAGLFAPIEDVIKYVRMWLGFGNRVLSTASRDTAVKCHTLNLNMKRGLGWVCKGNQFDHIGDLWPDSTVGHTGFTGTSITFDPNSGLWAILLTNEIHYGRENRTIGRLRALVHNSIAATMLYTKN